MKHLFFLGMVFSTLAAAQNLGSATITIRENGQRYNINCTGTNDVITVNGNNNVVTLKGTCENLIVYGNDNRIAGLSLLKVWLRGNSNNVTATQQTATPMMSNVGNNNQYTIGTLTNQPTKKDDKDKKGKKDDKNKKDEKDEAPSSARPL